MAKVKSRAAQQLYAILFVGREARAVKRREVITLLAGAAASPLAAHAQRAVKLAPRVGVLLYGTPETDPNYGSFLRGLRELGYVENQNIVLEPRSAEGKSERLPLLARELVAAKPDLIYVLGGDVAPSVRAATSTIPIRSEERRVGKDGRTP